MKYCGLLLCLSLISCGSSSGSNQGDGNVAQAIGSLDDSRIELNESIMEAVRIITQDFAFDVQNAPEMSVDESEAFDAAMVSAMSPALSAFITSVEMLSAVGDPISQKEHALTIGQKTQGLAFTSMLLYGAGVALTGYLGYRGVKKAVDQSAEPARSAITKATGQELEEINKSMGLPSDTSNEETLAKFDKLGIRGKLNAKQEIYAHNRHSSYGSNSISGDIASADANAAVTLGETGVKTYAGEVGLNAANLTKLAGATQKTAQLTSIAVKSVKAISSKVKGLGASKATVAVEIPAPLEEMSKEEAKKIMDDEVNGEEPDSDILESAVTTLAHDVVDEHTGVLNPEMGSGGAALIDLPEQIFSFSFEPAKVEESVSFDIPDVGPSDILFSTESGSARMITGIETGLSPEIELDFEEEEDSGSIYIMCSTVVDGSYHYACTLYKGDETEIINEDYSDAMGQCISADYRRYQDYFMGSSAEAECKDDCNERQITGTAQGVQCDTP